MSGGARTSHQYAFNVEDENTAVGIAIFTFIILITTCAIGLAIAVYALYRICWQNADDLKNVDKLSLNTAISCIILHAITVLLDPIGYVFWAANDDKAASIVWLIWDVCWTLSKLNLYFVYIYRCYITFKDTKYAYSHTKVYTPLAVAWFLQLINMVIFILHELDDIDGIADDMNPLSDDIIVVNAASIYLILELVIAFAVCWLFVNPVTKLITDLSTKHAPPSSQTLTHDHPERNKLIYDEQNGLQLAVTRNTTESESKSSSSSSSSSESMEHATTPHSPTKLGAAYYINSKADKNRKIPLTPTQAAVLNTQQTASVLPSMVDDDTSTMGTNLFKGACGKLPCPEDAANVNLYDDGKETEAADEAAKCGENGQETLAKVKGKRHSTKFRFRRRHKMMQWNEKQRQILNNGTRLALLSVISLSSGIIYQFLWILSVRLNRLGNFSYAFGVDTVINITCIYFSFQFAETEYDLCCSKCCHCHQCCLKRIENIALKRL